MAVHHPRTALSSWVDGELTPREVRKMRLHVASCASCRAALQAIQAGRRLAGRLERYPPGPSLWSEIMRELRNRRARRHC